LLEAMAAGLAIIATPAGAAADLLEDDENALVVPFADTVALAAGIERMLEDVVLRQRLGAAAQQRAATFEWPRVNADFAACLLAAVQRRAASKDRHTAVSEDVLH